MTILRILALLIFLLAGGCGYQVPGQQTGWGGQDGRFLYIDYFANRTAEPYLDHFLTESITRQMARSRQYELTEDRQAADLVLVGSAIHFGVHPAAYDQQDRITEYRTDLKIHARLLQSDEGRVLWQAELQQSENYTAVDDKSRQLELRSLAARQAAARLAEDLQASLANAF